MSTYTTRKETASAKAETRNRRQIREIKYSGLSY